MGNSWSSRGARTGDAGRGKTAVMKTSDLEARLRPYETASDRCVPPELYMVARLDGRGFSRLARVQGDVVDKPYDVRVRDAMIATTEHLIHAGFRVVYGYTQSDEISLLFHQDDKAFGRKLRKWISVLAGEASARFSLLVGELAAFDCRISELPNRARVLDYFRWRSEDAARNCLIGHCFWALRAGGMGADEATRTLAGASTADQHELLYRHGINFNDLPTWQKRGVGLLWDTIEQTGTDPRTGATTKVSRRRIRVELELPMKENYEAFVGGLVDVASDAEAV